MKSKALLAPKPQRDRIYERRETSLLAKVREPFLRAIRWHAATALFRYLHHAYKAGIPLEDAVASFGSAHPFLSRSIQATLQRALVQPNMPLSEILRDIGGDISPAVQALLRAGERHGRWEIVLEALREHAEQEREFFLKEMRALLFISGVAVALQALVVVGFAILTNLFLPLKLLLVSLAIIWGMRKLRSLLAHAPNPFLLAKERSWARFAHILGVLLKAGVPPSEALELPPKRFAPTFRTCLGSSTSESGRCGKALRSAVSLRCWMVPRPKSPKPSLWANGQERWTSIWCVLLTPSIRKRKQGEFRRGLATVIVSYLTVMAGLVLLGLFLLATGMLDADARLSLQNP